MVLQAGDKGQHGHGVEFGQSPEQWGAWLEADGAALQAECGVEYTKYLFGQVHGRGRKA